MRKETMAEERRVGTKAEVEVESKAIAEARAKLRTSLGNLILFRLWLWVSLWILSNEMQYAIYLDQQLLINTNTNTVTILVKKCWKWKCGRGWLLDFCRVCPSR
jgi:hypothetical protein